MKLSLIAAAIPLLPLGAAGITALLRKRHDCLASSLVIGAQAMATLLALYCFIHSLGHEAGRQVVNFTWLTVGNDPLRLGLLVDPLSAGMALMVTFVSLLIFIYSRGYMQEDPNRARFFCFLSLFSAAMLGVVLSGSLLLTFICWELVGLASYLLIGFWFHKPEAAAAAKKAFLTTRIGDMGFLLGMLWLYSASGNLLFYDNGAGCLESGALTAMATRTACLGLAVSNCIALLIFCGAAGKSGQFPLHVWLPDAMEGPTPVSALIHAATMVAAGVFLVARLFPLFSAAGDASTALTVVAWTGAFTALFAALIAVAQTDIKRILAYSTVSQLGFMMLALGVGSVAAAMTHLIAHAFFKALLFLGAGSVIHGVHGEQDIRRMGGLRTAMPVTFRVYAIGMMALSGVPFFFSGFWSKDEILHAAHQWPVSHAPFVMGVAAALLTAFYMTRQMFYVFGGSYQGKGHPHESPRIMTVPLIILACAAVLLVIPATPAWPWFHAYYTGHVAALDFSRLLAPDFLVVAGISIVAAATGIGVAWRIYGRRPEGVDPLEARWSGSYRALANRLYIDELYEATVIRAFHLCGVLGGWFDRSILAGLVRLATGITTLASASGQFADRYFINLSFDAWCDGIRDAGGWLSAWQSGRIRRYLRALGVGAVLLLALILWLHP